MTIRTKIAGWAAVTLFAVAGCGEQKTEIPKDLNKPLPPPPVGTGGKADKQQPPPNPSESAR
jgi:hypothetical protein